MWKSEDGLFTTFMPCNLDGQLKFKEQQITRNSNLLDYLDQINTQEFLFLCLLCNVMYAAMFFNIFLLLIKYCCVLTSLFVYDLMPSVVDRAGAHPPLTHGILVSCKSAARQSALTIVI